MKVTVRRSTSQTQPQKQEEPYLLLDIKLVLCFSFRFSKQHKACVYSSFHMINSICKALLHLNWINWQIKFFFFLKEHEANGIDMTMISPFSCRVAVLLHWLLATRMLVIYITNHYTQIIVPSSTSSWPTQNKLQLVCTSFIVDRQ